MASAGRGSGHSGKRGNGVQQYRQGARFPDGTAASNPSSTPTFDPTSTASSFMNSLPMQFTGFGMPQLQNGVSGPLTSPAFLPTGPFPPFPFHPIPGQQFWPPPFPPFPGASPFPLAVPQQVMPSPSQQSFFQGEVVGAEDQGLLSEGFDREEGELSDADIGTSHLPAQFAGNGAAPVPRSHAHSKSHPEQGLPASARQATARSHPELHSPSIMGVSQDVGALGNSAAVPQLANNMSAKNSTGPQRNVSSSHSLTLGKTADEIRSMARSAIEDMVAFDIKYDHYLAEGVNEDVLAGLFRELGLPVPAKETEHRLTMSNVPSAATAMASTQQGPANGVPKAQAAPEGSGDSKARQIPPIQTATSATDSSQPARTSQMESAGGDDRQGTTTPSSSAATGSNTSHKVRGQVSTTGPAQKGQPAASQLERKDLILQKLAAKRQASQAKHSEAGSKDRTQDASSTVERPQTTASLGALQETNHTSAGASSVQPKKNQLSAPVPPANGTALSGQRQGALSTQDHRTQFMDGAGAMSDQPRSAPEPPIAASATDEPLVMAMASVTAVQPEQSAEGVTQEQQSLSRTSSCGTGIPGLFLTSPAVQDKTAAQSSNGQLPNVPVQTRLVSRKRPVAADFDNEPSQVPVPTKRPFGDFRRQQSLVIDVSDEEDSGDEAADESAMSLDGKLLEGQQTEAQGPQTNQKRMSIRDMPPLPDFPPSRFVRTTNNGGVRSSGPGTPTTDGAVLRGKSITQEDLKKREEEIRTMRKAIADWELRKASQSKSRAQTPLRSAMLPPPVQASTPPVAQSPLMASTPQVVDPETSAMDREPSAEDDGEQARLEQEQLVAAKAAEAEERKRLARLKIEERIRRRKEIEMGLSQTQAEVEQERKRLEEIKAEREKREASVQEALQKRQQLEQELRLLDVDEPQEVSVEGLNHVEASETVAKDHEASKDSWVSAKVDPAVQMVPDGPTHSPTQDVAGQAVGSAEASTDGDRLPQTAAISGPSPVYDPMDLSEDGNVAPDSLDIATVTSQARELPPGKRNIQEAPISGVSGEDLQLGSRASGSPAGSESLREAGNRVHNKRDRIPKRDGSIKEEGAVANGSTAAARGGRLYLGNLPYAVTEGDLRIFFQGFSVEAVSVPFNPKIGRSAGYAFVDLAVTAEVEKAIVQLSDKTLRGRKISVQRARTDNTDDTTMAVPLDYGRHSEAEVVSSSPSETGDEMHLDYEPTMIPSPDQPASLVEQEDGELTPDSKTSDDSDDSDAYEPPEEVPTVISTTHTVAQSLPSPAGADDSPPFSPRSPGPMNASQEHAETIPSAAVDPVNDTRDAPLVSTMDKQNESSVAIPREGYFTPHDSPLKRFQSYRYHPNYLQDVSQGFRSLTYSHSIDPMKPLCQYEAAGGVCNDHSCGGQHFRQMELSDDRILFQLSDVKEERSGDEAVQYMAGLKRTLTELRARKVIDFQIVANEIVAYRSRVLDDPSRVLVLTPQPQKIGSALTA